MAAYEEQEYNNPFSFRIWMKLFPFFKPYKKFFAITLGLNILLAGVDILVPLFQSYAIDTFIIPDRLDGLGVFTLVYISVIVAQTVCVYVSVHAATSIEMNVGKDLKRAQFKHLQTLSFSYYNTTPVGYIHARVMSDTLRIAGMIAWGLVDMLGPDLCGQCVCDYVYAERAAGIYHHHDCSVYCPFDRVFPESDSEMEPEGEANQFPDYQRLQ